jgi:hypothetical protein
MRAPPAILAALWLVGNAGARADAEAMRFT